MATLKELAEAQYSGDPVTKPLRYYELYEQALQEEGLSPMSILEIGVYKGESTKTLARRFPSAHIVAIDMNLRDIDFSGYENVHYLQCDQTDQARLQSICESHFPGGVDLVIEDASHIGHYSRLTFNYVFPYVKSGGLYIVEDWGTGYMGTWPDGRRFADCKVTSATRIISRRIRSHDAGMVGFVKSLVDYTTTEDIGKGEIAAPGLIARLMLIAARFPSLRRIVEGMPHIRSRLVKYIEKPATGARVVETAHASTNLPRLKSLKFFRGVCIACKA